jgi:tetratricopeptide (TPR) repeat protein
LKAYCRESKPFSGIRELGKREKVRFWLEGQYQREGEGLSLALVLHDTEGMLESKIRLFITLDDQLLGVRKQFFDWLERCGLTFVGIEKANWPEHVTARGLDFLGRALETTYLNYIQTSGSTDLIDLSWFDRAVDASKNSYLTQDLMGWGLYKNGEYKTAKKAFASALELNPDGLGALSGMMWCAVSVKNREEALHYALAKANCRGEDPEKARVFVDKKFENLS